MNRRSRTIAAVAGLSVSLVVAGALGTTHLSDSGVDIGLAPDAPVIEPASVSASAGPPAADLSTLIEQLQTRLELIPADHVAWSTLGLAYVQQARVSADPSYYSRAEGALQESIAVEPVDNFLALAGMSALAAARHDFATARDLAVAGLDVNGYSALLYGALSDAELQLGDYDAADAAVERMIELAPDTPAFARASYLAELRGDLAGATELMERALADAGSPEDRAFALTILGDLAFNSGDPASALARYNAARAESPGDVAALAGKARAEAALGQIETALDHYAQLVDVAPEPSHLIAYGKLLESVGRTEQAGEQYAVVDSVRLLFEANGVELDADPILHLAERGDPVVALREAELAVQRRPFVAIHDAHAWALHVNGRDAEALDAITRAKALGTPNPRFEFHSGMIKLALGDRDGARRDLQRALDLNPYFDPLDRLVAADALDQLAVAR
jgi:tetratricopeptide (TPR) repeat protein